MLFFFLPRIQRIFPSLTLVDGNDPRQGQNEKQHPQKAKRESKRSETSISIGQAKQGTFQS